MSAPVQDLIPPPTEVNDTHKNYAYGIAWAILGALGTAVVIGRLAIRYRFRNFGEDDWAIIPAAILFLAWSTMASWLCLNVGVGKPLWEITVNEYSMWLNGQIACVWIYPTMSASIRIAILFFYKRIFGVDRSTKRLILGLLVLQVAYMIAFSIAPAQLCNNFRRPFYSWATECSYKYFKALQTSLYIMSLVLDLILFLFPLYTLKNLQMTNTQRIKLAAIFSFGAAATVVAAYKLGISIKEWSHIIPADSPFWKYQLSSVVPGQYNNYGTTFWVPSMLEPTIAILATSLPAFQQLRRRLTDNPSTEKSYSTGRAYTGRTGTIESKMGGAPRASLLKSKSTAEREGFVNLSSAEIELESQIRSKAVTPWADE